MTGPGVVAAALVLAGGVAARGVVARRRAARVARRLVDRHAPRMAPRLRAPGALARALAGAGIEVDPDVVWTGASAATVVLALGGAVAGGLALGLLLPVLAAAAGAGALVSMRGRGDRRYATTLPLALELVARSLRAGASLHQAIAEAGAATTGPVGGDLATIASDARLGRPLVAAVEEWGVRRPLPSVRLAAAALCLGAETGGAQARAIDGVAASLRDYLALDGEVRALTSQARMSAAVLVVAPIGFCAATVVVDSESASFLLRTPLGLVLLVAGLGLDAVAALWMHRLTSRVAA